MRTAIDMLDSFEQHVRSHARLTMLREEHDRGEMVIPPTVLEQTDRAIAYMASVIADYREMLERELK